MKPFATLTFDTTRKLSLREASRVPAACYDLLARFDWTYDDVGIVLDWRLDAGQCVPVPLPGSKVSLLTCYFDSADDVQLAAISELARDLTSAISVRAELTVGTEFGVAVHGEYLDGVARGLPVPSMLRIATVVRRLINRFVAAFRQQSYGERGLDVADAPDLRGIDEELRVSTTGGESALRPRT